MIVYLEGADGSGKSTLAHNIYGFLVDNYVPVFEDSEGLIPTHPKAEHRVDEEDMYNRLKEMANSKMVYLLDRGPISDIVYRVFDNELSVTNLLRLSRFLNNESECDNLMVIYCNNENSEQRMLERGDDNPVAINRHKELCKVYDIVMSSINHVIYDYENDFCWTTVVRKLQHLLKLKINVEGD